MTAVEDDRATPRVSERVSAVTRPLWETTLRDPVRDGHLRLDGLTGVQRQLAKAGLVALGLLLVSVLFSDRWRRGDLLHLYFELRPTFVPLGLMPVTLVTLTLAWVLLLWGALLASPLVKVFVGTLFGLTGSLFLAPTSIDVGDSWVLVHGASVVQTGYYTVLGSLALSLLVSLGSARGGPRAHRLHRWTRPVLQVLTSAAVAAFFLGHLWIHVTYVAQGFDSTVQSLIGGAVDEIDNFMLPLVYVAAVAVVKFGLDVSTSLATGLGELGRRTVRWSVLALLLVKLWFVLGAQRDYWFTYLTSRPVSVARTLLSLALLAVAVWWVAHLKASDAFTPASERLIYATSVALGLPFLVTVVTSCAGIAALTVLGASDVPGFVTFFTRPWLSDWGPIVVAVAGLGVGLWLLARRRTPLGTELGSGLGTELGSGLVVVTLWALPSYALNRLGLVLGFQDQLFDVAITLVLLVVLLAGWRRVEQAGLLSIAAIAVFAWLVMSRGDYIAFLGAALGLPAIVVTVFGIAYVVASDAGFTATDSRRLPQGSRVLLFVGYLLFSVTILHWNAASHAQTPDADLNAAFFYLGIPIAAWLLGRRLVPHAFTPAVS